MNRREFGLIAAALVVPGLAHSRPARPGGGRVAKRAEELTNGEFNWFPERSPSGPVVIIVSIPEQRVHVYRNGVRIAASTCSTGKSGHATPTGVFKILEKDKHHRSSTYNNAPMPNMNRLTWSGVALHAGNLPGYPASHGCVRLPLQFSELLFTITKLGMTVVIADNSSHPASVVHPGMVLGDYAKREFAAVDASVKHYQYSEGHRAAPVSVSVVVSARDKRITIWENDRIVATDRVKIENPRKPLGEHVYTLTKVNGGSDTLTWVTSDYSSGGRSTDAGEALARIRAYPDGLHAMQKRMHQGMTLITTDGSSDGKTMRSNGFTVFTAEG
ncbi:MAG: L,D-transpeptidase [Hyphomicrobiaceae bacterium]|nr:L,D-transpeptidase [Hyphomicrobiaceae bacterium]